MKKQYTEEDMQRVLSSVVANIFASLTDEKHELRSIEVAQYPGDDGDLLVIDVRAFNVREQRNWGGVLIDADKDIPQILEYTPGIERPFRTVLGRQITPEYTQKIFQAGWDAALLTVRDMYRKGKVAHLGTILEDEEAKLPAPEYTEEG